jgi:hypothetical protein
MFKNNSTFYRIVLHTIGMLFLIGVLGSTALGDENIFSAVFDAIYTATFGSTQTNTATGTSDSTSGLPPSEPTSGVPGGGGSSPPDTIK